MSLLQKCTRKHLMLESRSNKESSSQQRGLCFFYLFILGIFKSYSKMTNHFNVKARNCTFFKVCELICNLTIFYCISGSRIQFDGILLLLFSRMKERGRWGVWRSVWRKLNCRCITWSCCSKRRFHSWETRSVTKSISISHIYFHFVRCPGIFEIMKWFLIGMEWYRFLRPCP